MRRGLVGVAVSLYFGATSLVACGDAFTQANEGSDGGSHGDGAVCADGDIDTAILEGSVADAPKGDGHANDAANDGAAVDGVAADASMPDTSMPDTSMPDSAMDTGPTTDACTAVIASEATGVFVSTSGAASGCGSKAVPCNSIQTALNLAQTTSKQYVYVDNGTYTESITLVPNVTILGGWADVGGNWTRVCGATNAQSVILQAPTNANKTISAISVAGAAIDTLTVKSKTSNVGPSESIYGIFATGSTTLSLTNVIVSVVGGGTGLNGGSGGSGTNGTGTCQPPSNGANGGTGSGGASGQIGTYSDLGYAAVTGGSGGTGTNGNNGTYAAPGCVPSGDCDETVDTQCAGTISVSGMVCGAAGAPGCPGTGSSGGSGGWGGGNSIALYVWGASVTVSGGSLASGNGGGGGSGGPGGATVGQGSAGTTGAPAQGAPTTCMTHQFGSPPNVSYSCIRGGFQRAAGGVGGTGGNGGTGGTGGGGAGGSSYSYYFGGGGSVTPSGTSFAFGNPGSGGSGGNTGATGAAAAHN